MLAKYGHVSSPSLKQHHMYSPFAYTNQNREVCSYIVEGITESAGDVLLRSLQRPQAARSKCQTLVHR